MTQVNVFSPTASLTGLPGNITARQFAQHVVSAAGFFQSTAVALTHPIAALDRLLQRTPDQQGRRSILARVYVQITEDYDGKRQQGCFRECVERDSYVGKCFAWLTAALLAGHGLKKLAGNLRHRYSSDPEKPDTPLANEFDLLLDKVIDNVAVSQRRKAFDVVARGAIFIAHHKAEAQKAEPTFLYPTSRQYPFDQIASDMVRELEMRGFDIPGIKVVMESYGPNNAFTKVHIIEGEDFRLRFSRIQERIGQHWNNTAAVGDITIPGKRLSVYEGFSGPTLDVYVGDNWERDNLNFMDSAKANARLNGEPRTYVRYKGSWQRNGTGIMYRGRLAPLLSWVPDERDYGPQGDEPTYFNTVDVLDEIVATLSAKLEQIRKIPPSK